MFGQLINGTLGALSPVFQGLGLVPTMPDVPEAPDASEVAEEEAETDARLRDYMSRKKARRKGAQANILSQPTAAPGSGAAQPNILAGG